jgi:hypothetical protein
MHIYITYLQGLQQTGQHSEPWKGGMILWYLKFYIVSFLVTTFQTQVHVLAV